MDSLRRLAKISQV